MTVDAYTVIAGARRRGWTEGMIARKLGLRDGQTGYGVMRQDADVKPIVVIPSPRLPVVRRPDPPKLPAIEPPRVIGTKYSRAMDLDRAHKIAEALIAAVAELAQCAIADVMGPLRCARIAKPRQTAMYLYRWTTGASMPETAQAFGRSDHTTCRHAMQAVHIRLMETDKRGEGARLRNLSRLAGLDRGILAPNSVVHPQAPKLNSLHG